MILIFQLEISRLMCICQYQLFNRYTYFCVSYIIVISDRIRHIPFKAEDIKIIYQVQHCLYLKNSIHCKQKIIKLTKSTFVYILVDTSKYTTIYVLTTYLFKTFFNDISICVLHTHLNTCNCSKNFDTNHTFYFIFRSNLLS